VSSSSKTTRRSLTLAALLSVLGGVTTSSAEEDTPWCAPELEALSETVCYYAPPGETTPTAKTLVIFLHSLIGASDRAAWPLQLRMATHARHYGFTMLVPRGRPGLGPGRDPSVLAWPTAQKLQEQFEPELLAEWEKAQKLAEKKAGPFDHVFVLGFSNGAYYATSLAVRGKLDVDGYGVFAGGSGKEYVRQQAKHSKRRKPIFVGYGTQDPDHDNQQHLVRMLADLRWPHRSLAARVGHTVSDRQIEQALAFLQADPDE
jgi:predicted esterase